MDEKKKLMILVALVAVMACVGVFQVAKGKGGGTPPPPAVKPQTGSATGSSAGTASSSSTSSTPGSTSDTAMSGTAGAAAADPKKLAIMNPQVANELPSRDPFGAPADERPAARAAQPKVSHPTPMPTRFGSLSNSGVHPLAFPNKFGDVHALPGPGGMGGHPTALDAPFGYHAVGSISGDRPAVVLEDAAGNQKLVPVGGAIDGDSRVTRVENGAVTIESRGKKLRLSVGGNVDKK